MWFTENPWPPIVLFAVVAVGLTYMWVQRRQTKYLLGIAGCLVLSGLTWSLDKYIVTERERVIAAIYEITSQFQQGNLEETLDVISPQAPHIRALAAAALGFVEVGEDMRVTDVAVEMSGQQQRATSHFRVNATVGLRANSFEQRQPTRWRARWQLEDEQWRMIDIEELDPITGEPLDRLGRLTGFRR